MSILDAVISGFAGYQGTKANNSSNEKIAREANQFNAQEALKNRKWATTMTHLNNRYNERMSNTAVRRRRNDLYKAGINPILAGQYDASSPSGSVFNAGMARS